MWDDTSSHLQMCTHTRFSTSTSGDFAGQGAASVSALSPWPGVTLFPHCKVFHNKFKDIRVVVWVL